MTILIRAVQPKDAERIVTIMTQESVLPTIIATPSMRFQDFEQHLQNLGENQHQFVAVENGVVVGFAGLTRNKERRGHIAGLSLMIDQEHHGKGIGRRLMEKLIDLADNWLLIERLELTVVAGNDRAYKLYERAGFVEEGVLKGTIIQHGKFVDEITMARFRPGGLIKSS
ncbi:GNAT family N-acetyltransferase [Bacillus sp. SM2101]|uniref:GNAT family N-acetyltransferase n=1 Tax=Bacillus sp. SM2101 TaxID=2805366 RepID=UPI001BDE7A82|nr:GNAT family N-acetyltransferase [Bacillus sp. SM2101]